MSDEEIYEQISSGEEFQDGVDSFEEYKKNYVDAHRWRASEPPEEVFKESDLLGEWSYDIIGEQIDENGGVKFEVRWDAWTRDDGTRTTWNTPPTINPDHWKREQRKIRRNTASESLEIDIIPTTDMHNVETYLVHQAYKEKMKRIEVVPQRNLLSELAKLQAKHLHQDQVDDTSMGPKRKNQRASTRQKSEISLANSVRGASTSSRPSTSRSQSNFSSISSASAKSLSSLKPNLPRSSTTESSPPDSLSLKTLKRAHVKQVTKFKFEDKTEDLSIRASSSVENIRSPKRRRLSTDARSPAAQRCQLTTEWTKFAAQDKAAPIYIVNTVDTEPVPVLPPGFLYLESHYQFSSGVPRPEQMEDFLVKCTSPHCYTAASCECQAASTLLDETGRPMLAYTPEGYFAFNVPSGTEVVECNKLCGCSLRTCLNRVSQHPRDVPIEVFKTKSRGWGVRSVVDVGIGKVLGLYTGLVLPRETARTLPAHVNSDYVFDLDGDENGEGHPLHHPLFSVDSKSCGNWTRFINHSCAPNLQIYLVARDVPPANGLPFIAFVALSNIPAKTEFTFDYNPRAAERKQNAKKKGLTATAPEGAKICTCGAEACRGVLS